MNRIDRRQFLGATGALLVAPLYAGAQPRLTKARIGWLSSGASRPEELFSTPWARAFVQQLAELGWVEGRNLEFVPRGAGGNPKLFEPLAAELVAQKPDLIFAPVANAALAAKNATRDIPIVFALGGDPVAIGLVASLGRPGGNVTGPSTHGLEAVGKRLELFRELVPSARKLGELLSFPDGQESAWQSLAPWQAQYHKELARVAGTLGMEVVVVNASSNARIEGAIQELVRQHVDGFWGWFTPPLDEHHVVRAVNAARLPSSWATFEAVEAGGLLCRTVRFEEYFRQAAVYANKILRGAKPADLPVEQPTKIEVAINLKTAKALGLKIPQVVLLRADRVIE